MSYENILHAKRGDLHLDLKARIGNESHVNIYKDIVKYKMHHNPFLKKQKKYQHISKTLTGREAHSRSKQYFSF